jgi:hypothetical protein
VKSAEEEIVIAFLSEGFFITMARQPAVRQALLITEDSRSHWDTPESVGLLWMSE